MLSQRRGPKINYLSQIPVNSKYNNYQNSWWFKWTFAALSVEQFINLIICNPPCPPQNSRNRDRKQSQPLQTTHAITVRSLVILSIDLWGLTVCEQVCMLHSTYTYEAWLCVSRCVRHTQHTLTRSTLWKQLYAEGTRLWKQKGHGMDHLRHLNVRSLGCK